MLSYSLLALNSFFMLKFVMLEPSGGGEDEKTRGQRKGLSFPVCRKSFYHRGDNWFQYYQLVLLKVFPRS